tara:strand:+ start:571 stop:906 length:336 start_codon:yes stop_codon:yes gene_type:complete
MPTTYNGWTNYETWLCNLWLDGIDFKDAIEDGTFDDMCTEDIQTYVVDYLRKLVDEIVAQSFAHGEEDHNLYFAQDMMNSAIQEICFGEIAKQYTTDICSDERFKEQLATV